METIKQHDCHISPDDSCKGCEQIAREVDSAVEQDQESRHE